MSSCDSPIGFAARDSKHSGMRLSRFHHGIPFASFQQRGYQERGWLFGSPLEPGGYASAVVAFIAPVD
jgi:hypothetical protein